MNKPLPSCHSTMHTIFIEYIVQETPTQTHTSTSTSNTYIHIQIQPHTFTSTSNTQHPHPCPPTCFLSCVTMKSTAAATVLPDLPCQGRCSALGSSGFAARATCSAALSSWWHSLRSAHTQTQSQRESTSYRIGALHVRAYVRNVRRRCMCWKPGEKHGAEPATDMCHLICQALCLAAVWCE